MPLHGALGWWVGWGVGGVVWGRWARWGGQTDVAWGRPSGSPDAGMMEGLGRRSVSRLIEENISRPLTRSGDAAVMQAGATYGVRDT